jgi:uncharacterized protein with ParB-like and HNH nuclease domain
MKENILELKTVNELNQYSFFIPSYQRGYKWGGNETVDLLSDINDFKPRLIDESDEKTWYCLQPIVVQEIAGHNEFEVIDGQQRLTTLFLILNYLNQDFIIDKRDKLFELDYQTRKGTKDFLKNLNEQLDVSDNDNIDFYYISNAYKIIAKWFEDRPHNFDKGDFRSKLKFNSKVIWYQSVENNPISIFTRINIGKIPLTNSELIKALFLNSANYEKNMQDRLRLKQLEIATQWDQIEHSLQDERFWYFISNNTSKINRIEYIFDLMNEEDNANDAYSTFRFFSKKFQFKTQKTIEDNWKDIKDYYQRFYEWFTERDLYHKIGYLVCIDYVSIKDLYDKSSELTKSDFRVYLDKLIKDSLSGVSLEELQYGDKNVRRVLLLYNILTMLSSQTDNSYFPFNIYKNERWDIEHITSVKDTMPEKNRDIWLADAKEFISDDDGEELLMRAKICDINNDEEFKILFEDIVTYFNSGIKDEDINDISNLTLLDSETNRGYKNAVFPIKRNTIIKRDKAGAFIPLCTKNVFLKYFSEYPPKISLWTQDDRLKYEEDLYRVLDKYLEK